MYSHNSQEAQNDPQRVPGSNKLPVILVCLVQGLSLLRTWGEKEKAEVCLSPAKCHGILAVLWYIALHYYQGLPGLSIVLVVDVFICDSGINLKDLQLVELVSYGLGSDKRKPISSQISGINKDLGIWPMMQHCCWVKGLRSIFT